MSPEIINHCRLKTLFIDITQKCNLRCWFCYNYINRGKEDINTNSLYQLLLEAKELKASDIIYLGGEPTLHSQFYEILKFADGLDFNQCFITNGQFVRESFVNQISKIKKLVVGISLHSHIASIHDNITGILGSFSNLVKFIRLLEKYRIKWYTQTSLTKFNYQNIIDIYDFTSTLGENSRLDLSRLIYSHSERIVDDEFLTPLDYIDVFKQINRIINNNIKVRIEAFPRCWLKKIAKEQNIPYDNLRLSVRPCYAMINQLTVDIKGNVRFCPTGGHNFDNVFKNELKKVWYSSYSNSFRKFQWLPDECKKCDDFMFCYGACKRTMPLDYPTKDMYIVRGGK